MAERKLTPKQESFSQLVAAGTNSSAAYREAYKPSSTAKPATIHRRAKELMDNSKIQARVEELRSKHAKRHEITVDDLVAELEEARTLSHEVENPSAAVSATMGKGKLLGLVVDKSDNRHTIDFSGMSDDELRAFIARAAGTKP